MATTKTMNEVSFNTFNKYLKNYKKGSKIDVNKMRANFLGGEFDPAKLSGFITAAVRKGYLQRVGEIMSSSPHHNRSKVGVYVRL